MAARASAAVKLETPVQFIKGIGPRKAEVLAGVGIATVDDLLLYLPFRYEDRTRFQRIAELRPGDHACLSTTVASVSSRPARHRKNFTLLEIEVEDESGRLLAVWFNQPYLEETLTAGRRVLLYGKVEEGGRPGRSLQLNNPDHELVDAEGAPIHMGRVVPVYQRVGPISPRVFRSVFHRLIHDGLPEAIPELLPDAVRRRHALPTRREALVRVHAPEEDAELDALNGFRSRPQARLILEELFVFFVGVEIRRRQAAAVTKRRPFPVNDRIREQARSVLPFALTEAQKRAAKTIAEELASRRPMRRLLQGDVGSGKTIVGAMAALIVVSNRAQVALMAPTEILAEQHYARLERLLGRAGCRLALLRGSGKRAERDALLSAVAAGEVDVVVGTHALIQKEVRFKELGLVIVDEQHRFGVLQRAELKSKGGEPDVLIMTATPIPRSLAMVICGDMDVSELDELPPGRRTVTTLLVPDGDRERVDALIEREVAEGNQVYWVCPLVEASEKMDLRAVVATHRALSRRFAHRRVALVHGRLSPEEREATMSAFGAGSVDVLVATTVIEVGVDVPRATLMIVDHAERFGLSQLHQLRGRVGRGTLPSTAVLLYRPPLEGDARARLETLVESTDGFHIAERDLDIRGPGDLFGTRQSGDPLFRVADVRRDRAWFPIARQEAREFMDSAAAREPRGVDTIRRAELAWARRFELVAAG